MKEENRRLTNEAGAPVADNENAITAGPRGPVVMQDVWLMEKMAHFNREVIPERRMHAKGWGPTANSPSPTIFPATQRRKSCSPVQ